jgi:hypothetical protein
MDLQSDLQSDLVLDHFVLWSSCIDGLDLAVLATGFTVV